jgi:hypothetical protein
VTENDNYNEKEYYEAAAALRERQIQGKKRMRIRLAALSFTEKIKILEKLRDREKVIAAADCDLCLRRKPIFRNLTEVTLCATRRM